LIVFADVVILVALAAAVGSRRVSPLTRLVIATLALACAWLVAGGLDTMRVPGWTVLLSGAVIVVSIGTITATLHAWTQGGDDGDTRPGHGGDHGGDGSPPSWWPDFERQLALYAAERDRARTPAR
jgi:hypothetical protein